MSKKSMIILGIVVIGIIISAFLIFRNQTPYDADDLNQELIEENEFMINLQIGERTLTATLVDNSSARALLKELENGPITINMRDYGSMEKVGALPNSLPRNDEPITAGPGDIILYQGNALVIYYDNNSWNFTRLGHIDGVTTSELRSILGTGSVTVTLTK